MLASEKRETKETCIDVILETEGAGIIEVDTKIELLDEILRALAKGALFDLTVIAKGDLETGDHHTTEDTGIALGRALSQLIKKRHWKLNCTIGPGPGHSGGAFRRARLPEGF